MTLDHNSMFKNRIDKYIVDAGFAYNQGRSHVEYECTLDKLISSLSDPIGGSLDGNLVKY